MAVQKVLEGGCGTKYSNDGTVASSKDVNSIDGQTHVNSKRQRHDVSDDDDGERKSFWCFYKLI